MIAQPNAAKVFWRWFYWCATCGYFVTDYKAKHAGCAKNGGCGGIGSYIGVDFDSYLEPKCCVVCKWPEIPACMCVQMAQEKAA